MKVACFSRCQDLVIRFEAVIARNKNGLPGSGSNYLPTDRFRISFTVVITAYGLFQ
jgi:hypothetical protein